MATNATQRNYAKSMELHISPQCLKILRDYAGLLRISEAELINRMILSFAKADADLLSCLLMRPLVTNLLVQD